MEKYTETEVVECENKQMFAVFRNGRRVSGSEYDSEKDPYAIAEASYWKGIITRYPDGSKISIRPVKHRSE